MTSHAYTYDAAGCPFASRNGLINRQVAAADYGTAGGGDWERPEEVSASSDTVLVSRTRHGEDGESSATIDPEGRESRRTRDAAGRVARSVENVDPAAPPGDAGANDLIYFLLNYNESK